MPAARPTEAAIARAIRGVEKAGLSVCGVDFLGDGQFRVLVGEPSQPLASPGASEEERAWEEALAAGRSN